MKYFQDHKHRSGFNFSCLLLLPVPLCSCTKPTALQHTQPTQRTPSVPQLGHRRRAHTSPHPECSLLLQHLLPFPPAPNHCNKKTHSRAEISVGAESGFVQRLLNPPAVATIPSFSCPHPVPSPRGQGARAAMGLLGLAQVSAAAAPCPATGQPRPGGGAGRAGELAARPSPAQSRRFSPQRRDALSRPEDEGDGAAGAEQQLQQRWVQPGPGRQRGGSGTSPAAQPRGSAPQLSPAPLPRPRGSGGRVPGREAAAPAPHGG